MQYPGLRGAANADLTTLSLLSAAAAVAFPDFKLSWLYDELRHKLEEELGGWGGTGEWDCWDCWLRLLVEAAGWDCSLRLLAATGRWDCWLGFE